MREFDWLQMKTDGSYCSERRRFLDYWSRNSNVQSCAGTREDVRMIIDALDAAEARAADLRRENDWMRNAPLNSIWAKRIEDAEARAEEAEAAAYPAQLAEIRAAVEVYCDPPPNEGHVQAIRRLAAERDRLREALKAAEELVEKTEDLDNFTRCACCENYAEVTVDVADNYQCIPCTMQANAEAERDRLREALESVEFAGWDSMDGEQCCPGCGALKSNYGKTERHSPDCIVGRALGRPECREVGGE